MSFTSLLFLFCFLPLLLVLYYSLGEKIKPYVLVIASIVFYSFGTLKYLLFFIAFVTVNVGFGRYLNQAERKSQKVVFIFSIVFDVLILMFFKYINNLVETLLSYSVVGNDYESVVFPVGLSFLTFKSISYLVDIYKKKIVLSNSIINDFVYLTFFPQILSGPISRYNDLIKDKKQNFDINLFSKGIYRYIIGFSKKIILSDILLNVSSEVFSTAFENFSVGFAWLGSICYALVLYFDFSGYSDMSIGVSNMFGYECKENFNYPYMTKSVGEFWRRWHISLGSWFKDYVYIPLGGSRNENRWRVYFNLFVVWILTGIWHGTGLTYICWGMMNFAAIAFERLTGIPDKITNKLAKVIYRILVLLYINCEWIMFNSNDVVSGLRFIKRLVLCTPNEFTSARTLFLFKEYWIFILAGIVLCTPVVSYIKFKIQNKKAIKTIFDVISCAMILLIFIWAISYVVSGENNPFAYANF